MVSRRQLAAVMLTDMVGYSALAQRAEGSALDAVGDQERITRRVAARHAGRVVKALGDGHLIEFASALEAVESALEIQRAIGERNAAGASTAIQVRIGIHLGDVVRRGADLLGDCVNIAARIYPLADPGGICVSQQVFDQVRNKVEAEFVPIGTPRLKNIAVPISLYRVGSSAARPAAALPTPTLPRVAVLPLVNLSGRSEDEFFADGVTEELIQTVSKIVGLRVIGRSSVMRFKQSERGPKEIAQELGATAVVEGAVRKQGNRLRVTARLLEPVSSEALWSGVFDRQSRDLFALQSEIAERIARALRVEILGGERRALERPVSPIPEAHAALLRARYQLNQRTEESLREAIRGFQEALRHDPRLGRAYAGLADAHSTRAWLEFVPPRDAFPRARTAARRAVALDPASSEAHTALGFVRFLYERDWVRAEAEFLRAVELNPSYPTAHQFYSDLLKAMGRLGDAEAEVRRALELDPLSLAINTALGHVLYLSRQYDAAIEQYRRSLALDPRFVQAHLWFGRPYLEKGMYERAIEEVRIAVRLSSESTMSLAVLGHAYASAGRTREAGAVLRRLKSRARTRYVPSYWVGLVYVGLDDRDRAFEWLARAEQERSAWLAWVKVEPRFDRLRADPRFSKLLGRLKLD